jgi:hypothetical protein
MKPLNLDKLLFRAHYRCEYCQTVLYSQSWHREHVNPRSKSGSDSFNNLAVSCPRCNLNKGNKTRSKDLITGKVERFFNPRTDYWEDHFGIVAGQLVGKTPIGRATASILFRRTEQRLPPDLKWWPLREINNETVYMFLNHQRARRLANNFADLQHALNKIPFLEKMDNKSTQAATFATHVLIAENLYTRSRASDVKKAVNVIEAISNMPNLDTSKRAELLNITAVVMKQLSTVMMLEGKAKEAKRVLIQAIKALEKRLEIINRVELNDHLRISSLRSRIESTTSIDFQTAIMRAADEASEGQYSGYTYLVDTVVNQNKFYRKAEKLLDHINRTMLTIGYGQNFDYAKTIIVRRRWWLLNTLINQKCDLGLLESDLSLWKDLEMANEIREFQLALQEIDMKVKSKNIKGMLHVVKKVSGR